MTLTSNLSSPFSPNMALEAVVFPQDPFLSRDLYAMALEDDPNAYHPPLPFQEKEEEEDQEEDQEHYVNHNSNMLTFVDKQQQTSSGGGGGGGGGGVSGGRKKRRRTKACKNEEEVENQRMTHIAVERNRRKQMNEYLAVLRSLMPPSYVQRGDQASIIGGAINFVKELEQLLQSMEARKRRRQCSGGGAYASLFADFFTFPQYTTCSSGATEPVAENRSAIADIEVTIVESHVNLKVLSRRRPRQLLKMVVGLQSLRLTTLHLNVTTVEQMVLYSFSLKVEEDCHLTSVDEIATAVYQMLGRIKEESGFK